MSAGRILAIAAVIIGIVIAVTGSVLVGLGIAAAGGSHLA